MRIITSHNQSAFSMIITTSESRFEIKKRFAWGRQTINKTNAPSKFKEQSIQVLLAQNVIEIVYF